MQKNVEDKRPVSERVDDTKNISTVERAFYQPVSIGPKPNTYLGIIEFTDQGMLREPKQFLGTNAFIKGRPGNRPMVLVIFVHGWNHNASPRDGNLRQFRDILINLRNDVPSGDILGIYLGWPGNVRMLPFVSYFSRLGSAERVGRVTCTEVMLSLIAHARAVENGDKSAARQNVKTIVIGHSMGGLIVERAFLQAMIGYGLTNATTSDQVESLRSAQAAEVKTYADAADQEREKLSEMEVDLDAAVDREAKAKEDFGTFDSMRTEKRKLAKTLGEKCAETTDVLESLMDRARKLQQELSTLADGNSWSDGQRKAILDLAVEIYHTREGVDDSVYHALKGLHAWGLKPEKASASEISASQFRKNPENYVDELRTTSAEGWTWPPRVQGAWGKLMGVLRTPLDGAEIQKQLNELFGISNGQVSEPETVFGAVRTLESDLKAHSAARADLEKYEKTETFVKFETELTQAIVNCANIENMIKAAHLQISGFDEKKLKAAELEKKLDIVHERPPADLIMLINPASDALLTEQMRQVWDKDRGGDLLSKMWRNKKIRPWIVSISSDFDAATRIAYPLGMGISRLFRGAARPEESRWMIHTAPHVREMQTHALGAKNNVLWLKDLREQKGMRKTPLWIVSADKETDPEHNVSTENFVRLVPFLLRETAVLDSP